MTRPASTASTRLDAELEEGAAALGLDLDAAQRALVWQHLDLVTRWNRVYNLTAVDSPPAMLAQHALDSLAFVAPLRRHTGGAAASVLDVGSGAGLPGVMLAIACPELSVTCVDAVAKKASFVRQVAAELGLANLSSVHARVETLRPAPWDVITARAFASLNDLAELTRPLLAPTGVWAALKGQVPQDELAALHHDVDTFHVEQLEVPGLNAQRCIVWMRPVHKLS